MIQIKKTIKNYYINFYDDIQEYSKIKTRNPDEIDKNWGSIINVYDTQKYMEPSYFDFLNHEIHIKNIQKGNVVQLRNKKKICNKSSLVFNEFYLITDITSCYIIMENYETIAKAVRAQRKKSSSGEFMPIPFKSKWKKYSKHI